MGWGEEDLTMLETKSIILEPGEGEIGIQSSLSLIYEPAQAIVSFRDLLIPSLSSQSKDGVLCQCTKDEQRCVSEARRCQQTCLCYIE